MTTELQATQAAVAAIESAQKIGIRVVLDGDGVGIDNGSCTDAEQVDAVVAILRSHKQAIEALASSQATVKQILAAARSAIVEADKYVHDHLDLWLRLEDVYRNLWPVDKGCITGDGQCGEIRSEIVRCRACEEKA